MTSAAHTLAQRGGAHVTLVSTALTFAGFAAVSAALYRPTVSIGLLSDDFVLADWALSKEVAPDSWPYLRPVPMALWAVLSALVDSSALPTALHLLSLLVHALNGTLVALLARRLTAGNRLALAAGALFVVYPSSVEAVAWPAAFSDVLLSSWILATTCLLSRTAVDARVALVVVALLSLACHTKETAAATPFLFALLAMLDTPFRRSYLVGSAIAACVIATYAVSRLAMRGVPTHPGISMQGLGTAVVDPLATLSLPFHVDVLTAAPSLAMIWMAGLLVTLAVGLMSRPKLTTVVISIACVYAAMAPTAGLFDVQADLQGSRYLYLPTAAWVLLLAGGASVSQKAWRTVSQAGLVLLLVVGSVATVRHQRPWREAASTRDMVVDAISRLPAHCRQVFAIAPPDNVRGAYVARNGLTQAMWQRARRRVEFVHRADDTPRECRVDFADLSEINR